MEIAFISLPIAEHGRWFIRKKKMPVINHVHKYIRKTVGRNNFPIYRCILPDCSHFLQSALVEGRKSLCYFCDKEFIINRKQVARGIAKPQCGCKNKIKVKKLPITDVGDILQKFGITGAK